MANLGNIPLATYDDILTGTDLSDAQKRGNTLAIRRLIARAGLDALDLLYLPAGTVDVLLTAEDVVAGVARGFTIPAGIDIHGYGKNQTIIRCFVDAGITAADLFYIPSPGDISDLLDSMTMVAPTGPGTWRAIRRVGTNGNTADAIDIDLCRFTGWDYDISSAGGAVTITALSSAVTTDIDSSATFQTDYLGTSTPQDYLDARIYGLTYGPGQTQAVCLANKTALQNAIDAAISLGLDLWIARGYLQLEVPSGNFPTLDIGGVVNTGSVGINIKSTDGVPFRIFGDGDRLTQIVWGPTGATPAANGPAFPWHGFFIDPSVKHRYVTFSDLSIDGDMTTRADRDAWGILSSNNTSLINVTGSTNGNKDFSVTLERVRGGASSYCTSVIDGFQVPGKFVVRDSYLKSANNPCSWFPGDTTGGYWHAYNTEFHSGGFGSGGSTNVGVYVHPSVSVYIDAGCRFYDVQRYAVYSNGSPTTAPEYFIIEGAYFGDSCGFGIQSCPNIKSLISVCQFRVADRRGITLTGSANVIACDFESNGGIAGGSTAAGSFSSGDIATITGCTFKANANGLPDALLSCNGGGKWVVSGCHGDTQSYTSVYVYQVVGTGTRAGFSNCTATGTAAAYAVSITDACHVTIDQLECTGAIRQIRTDQPSGGTLQLTNNRLLATGYVYESVNPGNNVVSGWGNQWNDDSFVLYETDRRQQLQLRQGAGGNVASATDMLLSPNFDFYNVTGVNDIENIFVGRIGANDAASQGYTNLFSGRFCLRYDAAVKTLSTGNLVPLTTAARTPGSLSFWQIDPSASKIYEV